MSIQSAKAFLDKMKSNEDFAKKIANCKDQEERLALLKKEGYDFTPKELEQAKNAKEKEPVISGGREATIEDWQRL